MFTMSAFAIDMSPSSFKGLGELPELKLGDRHEGLADVQRYLKRFGYLNRNAPVEKSVLDGNTVQALKNFQLYFGLDPSGQTSSATIAAMMQKRCGLPDFPLAYVPIGPWTRKNLTYAFGTITAQVPAANAKTAIRQALDTWANAGVGLSFQEVTPTQHPDIRIEWRPENDPDHSMAGNIIAHADFPPGFSVIVNELPLPLHFDDSEHWAIGNYIDIQSVALHEIGHILGLGHTNVKGAVMYPSYEAPLTALQHDDINGLTSLYGAPVVVQDATAEELGQYFPQTDDHYFHVAAHRWALARGFASGVPCHERNHGISGIICFKPRYVDIITATTRELSAYFPLTDDHYYHVAAHRWAIARGYVSGIPCHERNLGNHGIICIKTGYADILSATTSELAHYFPQDSFHHFHVAAHRWAMARGYATGIPCHEQNNGINGIICLRGTN